MKQIREISDNNISNKKYGKLRNYSSQESFIKKRNNIADSVETRHIVIAHLLPRSDQRKLLLHQAFSITDDKTTLSLLICKNFTCSFEQSTNSLMIERSFKFQVKFLPLDPFKNFHFNSPHHQRLQTGFFIGMSYLVS